MVGIESTFSFNLYKIVQDEIYFLLQPMKFYPHDLVIKQISTKIFIFNSIWISTLTFLGNNLKTKETLKKAQDKVRWKISPDDLILISTFIPCQNNTTLLCSKLTIK